MNMVSIHLQSMIFINLVARFTLGFSFAIPKTLELALVSSGFTSNIS